MTKKAEATSETQKCDTRGVRNVPPDSEIAYSLKCLHEYGLMQFD